MTSKELITELYIGYFDRAPDPEGLNFWIGVLDSGALTLEEIAQDFATQPETKTTYPFLETPPTPENPASATEVEAFINAIYDNLFDRAPDTAGFDFWSGVLQDGFSPGTFILAVIGGADAADRAVLDNKIEVGCAWVEAAEDEDGFVLSDAYIADSKAALGDVTADQASVDAGVEAAALFFQEAPSVALENTTTTLGEDVDLTTRLKVADIVVTDDGVGTNVLALTGDDAGLFEIDGTELFIQAGAALDFETNAALDVTVTVDDAGIGASPDDTAALSIALTDANDLPTVALANVVASLPEDTDTSAAIKLADIVVTDDALGTNDLSLIGADAALFRIIGTEVFLRAGTALDFEAQSTFDVGVVVDDASIGSSQDDAATLSFAITDVNEAPGVTLANTVSSLAEDTDTSAAVKIADIVVSDDALGTNGVSLSGDDAGLFEIVGTELFLKAGTALDFETNPALDVSILVDDPTVGATPDDTDALSVTITNVNEAPSIALTGTVTSLAEDTDTGSAVKVADIVVTDDGQGSNTLALVGADAAFFEIVGTELFLKAGTSLDFESNPAFDVSVTVDDATLGGSPDDSAALTVAITDVNEAPAVALNGTLTSLLESDDTSVRIKVADILLSDDGLGTNVLGLTGDDAGLFEIDGTELFLKAGTVLDADANASLDVSVTVDDATLGGSPDGAAALSIVVTDVNDAPQVALENVVAGLPEDTDTAAPVKVADIVVTDDLAGSNTLALTGADAGSFEILGSGLFLKAGTSLDFETDTAFDVSVTVDDPTLGAGVDDTASTMISITDVNEAPSVSLAATITTLPENTPTAAPTKVAEIVITDDALGTNVLGLTGADAASFEILGTDLFLKTGTVLDFETDALLNVTVTVDDADISGTPDAAAAYALTITNVNEAPTLSLIGGETELFEGTNTTNRVLMGTIAVNDDGTGTNTLALTGADAGLFEIVGNGLFLKAGTVLDADANPTLDVTVTVDDVAIAGSPDDSVSLSTTVSPGAPGAAVENTNSFTLLGNAANTVRFGQIEVADADPITPGNQPGFVFNTNPDGDPYAGVAGSILSILDTTGHDGLVSLGVIADIDGTGLVANTEGFLLNNAGSAGDVEACLGEADVFGTLTTPELASNGEWIFDNTGATGTMEISLKEVDLNAGGILTFLNVDIVIEGDIDLTVLGDDLTIDAFSTIEVAAGGVLTLTVAQVDDLEDAGVDVQGAGTVVVTGESDDSDGEINTDFNVLQTGTVDLSAVTLAATDADDAVNITVSGATSEGDRITQTVIGTANNDAVVVASTAADADLGTLDVILELGADDGDIGDPVDTPVGVADPAEMVGDTIDLDSNILGSVQINVDAGFDAVTGSGFASRIDVQVASGAEFYAPLVVGDYVADAISSNDGTAVLEADGTADQTIDVSATGGSEGWILIGVGDGPLAPTTLVGSDNDDQIVDGAADDDNNSGDEDTLTGNDGADVFIFNLGISTPAVFADIENNPAFDEETITVDTADGADDGNEAIIIDYAVGDTLGSLTVSDLTFGSDIDFDSLVSVSDAIASMFDAIGGITATSDGVDTVTLSGDNGERMDTSITGFVGTTTTLAVSTADGTDTTQDNTVTITGTASAGEIYTLTVQLSEGFNIEAEFTAAGGESATAIAAALIADFNATAPASTVLAAAGGGAGEIDLTDEDPDNGGFEVTVSTGVSAISGSSASSLLVGGETYASADIDVITDFLDADGDMIDFGLAEGSGSNYGEDASQVDFATAQALADSEFAMEADLVYFLTGSDADGVGLLFINSDGDTDADTVVALVGVNEGNFDDDNIAGV